MTTVIENIAPTNLPVGDLGRPDQFESVRGQPYTSQFGGRKVNFARILRSEWLKLWSLRSTWWTVGLTILLMAGFALLFASVINTVLNNPESVQQMGGPDVLRAALNGVVFVTLGYQFAQLTVAVLGVLTITNEYTSGMIRATLAAAPRRLSVLLAKLLVLIAVTTLIAVIGLALSWLVTYPILNNQNIAVDFSQPETIRSLIGVVLYLIAIAVFSLGLGALIRHTAGGISAIVAILMVVPMIFQIILVTANAEWAQNIFKFLPGEAGSQLIEGGQMAPGPGGGMLGAVPSLEPWPGFAVLAGYALLTFIAAMIAMRRRDA